VHTKTTLPGFKSPENTVVRRYNDFLWLFEQLHETRGYLVPPLPEKGIISRFSPEFIEFRRKELEKFLNRVGRHPRLYLHPTFRAFLEASDEGLTTLKSQVSKAPEPTPAAEAPPAEKKSSFASFFGNSISSITSITQASISGVKEVDPWFEAKKNYLAQLEQQLTGLLKATSNLIKKRRETAQAFSDFGAALTLVSHVEADHDSMSSGLYSRLQQISDQRNDLYHEVATKEETFFEDAIKDYLRMLVAIKDMFADRHDLLMDLATSQRVLESKKEKLAKAKAKTAPLQQEVDDATRQYESHKKQFEEVSARCKEELNFFDRTRQWEIKRVVTNLCQYNLEGILQSGDLYKNFITHLHTGEEGSRPDNDNLHQGEVDRAGWGGNGAAAQYVL